MRRSISIWWWLIGILAVIAVFGAFLSGQFYERRALTARLSALPCSVLIPVADGQLAVGTNYDECREMRAVHLRGRWSDGFEYSDFIPAGQTERDTRITMGVGDLTRSMLYKQLGIDPASNGQLVADVEFEGLTAKRPGRYGHLASYRQVVVPRKIISVRLVSWKPD